MKYLPLIWAGIWRNRSRAILMLLQIASAFLLFGLLQGVNSAIKQALARTHSERLYVGSAVSLGVPLPISLLPQIKAVPGVKVVTPFVQVPAIYQKRGQGIPMYAVDPEAYFSLGPDLVVPKEQVEALVRNRTGAILGATPAKRYGLKVGDRLALQSQLPRRDGTNAWVFDIVGIFDNSEQPNGANAVIVHYDYVNEARLADRDTVLLYVALAENEKVAPEVGRAIDRKFANSSTETRTQSEGDLIASQIQRIADIDLVVGGIVSAVFFALLLATGALMMQSIRERVPELAVLKTLGFSDKRVMVLILVEAVVFCVFSAAVGLGLASIILPAARSMIGITAMPMIVFVTGVLFAVALALIGASVPAWRGLRLQVADALAGR
ncbi:MAG: FtsX-like permease family protein [Steroidobacteraceae bacterium]|nr:FtsX-like permease family protein [Steroidobacteraceae bacterium]